METIIRDVQSMAGSERAAAEALLGHSLAQDQRLFIMVISPLAEPDAAQRHKAWEDLHRSITAMEAHLQDRGVTAEAWNAALDLACEEVRYGKSS